LDRATRQSATLHVTVCEIEAGLYCATYPRSGAGFDASGLPTYEVGGCAADAKRRLEASIRALGYETIVWREGLMAPHAVTGVSIPPSLAVLEGTGAALEGTGAVAGSGVIFRDI
jgi:hypothetical protein